MNKTKFVFLSIFTSVAISLAVVTPFNNVKSTKGYTNGDASTYYNSVGQYSKGDTLISELNSINNNRRKRLVGYNSMMSYFDETDPGDKSNQVTSFYSGTNTYKSNCNREHVWPNSHGGNVLEDDIHMVRPTLSSENEGRGNSFYVEGMNTEYDGWDPANCGNETYRGDAARIVFYCVIADPTLEILDLNKHHTTSEDNDYKMGKLSDLLKWNLQYPVHSREKVRNEAAESIQGNRNPFIDHPEYACRIWGDKSAEAKRICGAQGISGEIKINQNNTPVSNYVLEVEDEVTFTANISNSINATYSWSLSDQKGNACSSDVVSIASNNGSVNVTGVKQGEVYLKATANVTLGDGSSETLWCLTHLVVKEKVTLTALNLESLPYDTDYNIGEVFNSKGIKLVAVYSDKSTEDVTNLVTYSDTSTNVAGVKMITVSYTYKDVTLSQEFPIIIREGDKPTPSGGNSSGCGGNIATSSILLSALALVGTLLITITIKKRNTHKSK